MPVLTAHPTEARRRTVLDHLAEVAASLDTLERPRGPRARDQARALDQLRESIALSRHRGVARHAADAARRGRRRARRLRRTLLEVTPRSLPRDRGRARRRTGPGGPFGVLPPFLRWGTLDRRRPRRQPATSPRTSRAPRSSASARSCSRATSPTSRRSGAALSMSALRAQPESLAELDARSSRDRERLPEVAARARAHAPCTSRGARSSGTSRRACARTLERAERRLRRRRALPRRPRGCSSAACAAAGFAALAARDAARLPLRRAEVFGFHLATLDLRQHSAVHERVVGELLARGGRPGYLELPEDGRACAARRAARPRRSSPRRATARRCPPRRAELLATLDMVGRARRELGPARLRALHRQLHQRRSATCSRCCSWPRAAGLAPGELRPVPLLEQLEDLERAGAIGRADARRCRRCAPRSAASSR